MPRRLDLRRHVGEHELDSLEARDRLSELLPFSCVVQRVVEGAFGDAERLRPDPGSRSVEHGERDLEPCAVVAKSVGGRHLDVVEHELRGGRPADAQLVLELKGLPRARLPLEHERGYAPVVCLWIRLGENDERAGGAASDPLPVSYSAYAATLSPDASGGHSRFFCSSVPATRIGYEPRAWTARIKDDVAHAFAISSMPMQMVTLEPEIPPYSSGKGMPRIPLSAKSLSMSFGYSAFSSISAARGATRSWTSSRIVSRIATCSCESSKSMSVRLIPTRIAH